MAKNEEELFDVEFGDSGMSVLGTGVTQPDTKTVDDPGVTTVTKPATEKKGKDEFELVEELIDSPEETNEEPEEVEEPKEEPKKKTETPSSKETKGASDKSFALVFARYQMEEGNLGSLDEEELKKIIEEEGEAAAIGYIFNKEVENRLDDVKKMYSEDRNEIEEYISLKDSGIDADRAKELVYTKSKFENITNDQIEEDEEVRKIILSQNYKNTTNFSPDKIKKLVDRAIATGEDIDEAKEALETINKFNKEQIEKEKKAVEEMEQQQATARKTALENMKKKILEAKEVIPGYPISKKDRQGMQKLLFEPAAKDTNGNVVNGIWAERLKDPVAFDSKLAFLIQSGIWDGKLDNLKKAAKTEAVKDLERVIESKGGNLSKRGTTVETDLTDDDSLTALKKLFPMA